MSDPNTVAAPIEDPAVDGSGPDAEEEDLGIPSLNEPFIQKYMDGRDALIAQEKRQRSDHAFRENMTPMAAEAAATVSPSGFKSSRRYGLMISRMKSPKKKASKSSLA